MPTAHFFLGELRILHRERLVQESFALKTPDADGSQIMVVVDLLNALPFLGLCQRRSNTMVFSAFRSVSLSAHVRVPSQTHTLVTILAFPLENFPWTRLASGIWRRLRAAAKDGTLAIRDK